MPRDGFISDKLVVMGAKQRQKQNEPQPEPGINGENPPPGAPANERKVSAPADVELLRLRRDLSERLAAGMENLRAEKAEIDFRTAELDRILPELEAIQSELAAFETGVNCDKTAVEKLRIRFFGVYGRFRSTRNQPGVTVAEAGDFSFRREILRALPLALAILAGSTLIVCAILLVFSV